jgi:hypothetical protein
LSHAPPRRRFVVEYQNLHLCDQGTLSEAVLSSAILGLIEYQV